MTKKIGFWIVWPEQKSVSARQIITWYGDAKFNGDIPKGDRSATAREKALALSDAGIITLRAD